MVMLFSTFGTSPHICLASRMKEDGEELDREWDLNFCFICGVWAFINMNSN